MSKRTKIIATIGPASSSPIVIAKLIKAGMDAARLNFSHGERKDHIRRIRLIKQASLRAGKPIAIIQDLQGPKLRVGAMQNDGAPLKRGDTVTITTRKVVGTASLISITYPRLTKDLASGDTVLFDDGRLEARVVRRKGSGLQCKVVRGAFSGATRGSISRAPA